MKMYVIYLSYNILITKLIF